MDCNLPAKIRPIFLQVYGFNLCLRKFTKTQITVGFLFEISLAIFFLVLYKHFVCDKGFWGLFFSVKLRTSIPNKLLSGVYKLKALGVHLFNKTNFKLTKGEIHNSLADEPILFSLSIFYISTKWKWFISHRPVKLLLTGKPRQWCNGLFVEAQVYLLFLGRNLVLSFLNIIIYFI